MSLHLCAGWLIHKLLNLFSLFIECVLLYLSLFSGLKTNKYEDKIFIYM